MHRAQFANYITSLLMLCSPFAALPALIGLTDGLSHEEKKRTGIIAGLTVGIILLSMTWVGGAVLKFLGITVSAFQVAGGFVIFLLALSMLNAETSRIKQAMEDQKEARKKPSIAIVPLAIPIMAGPGAISSVIVAANNFPGVTNQIYLSGAAIIVAFILGVTLYFATPFEKLLGQNGINILNRVAGLVLSAMAIQTMANGLMGLFPFLASSSNL